MLRDLYSSLRWRTVRARAIERDGGRCTVSRLLGGAACSAGPPHVHHIEPVREGGAPLALDNVATVCASHHPRWEALRRAVVHERRGKERPVRCPHQHRTRESRELCEARMRRQRQRELAA